MNDYREIFDFIPELDRKDRQIWKIIFKHNRKLFKMALTKERAEGLAFNWVSSKKNEKELLEIMAELSLLM